MDLPFNINLKDKVVVVTGGSGVLGSTICEALAKAGAKVVVLARNEEKINNVVESIQRSGGQAFGYSVDVLDKTQLEEIHAKIVSEVGQCNILINGAGGNHPGATTSHERLSVENLQDEVEQSFFDLRKDAVENLFHLNFLGTLLPTQVFAKNMVKMKDATIINVSSMNANQPLTKIPAYSAAKASISNFTQWLAVYFSKVGIRVNAIAPGFFLTDQNRGLLVNEDGEYSERARKILSQTPMERFGEADELIGTLFWLVNTKASSFVNGVVIPIDGGFSAYSGV